MMKFKLTKKHLIIVASFLLMIFFILLIHQTTQPKLEYSIEKLAGFPSESLASEIKENSIELNQIVHWAGSYKPRLEKEVNTLKIIFIRETVVSLVEAFNFKATITNLNPGKYKVQLIYGDWVCLYENSEDWEACSKLDITERKLIDTKEVFRKTDEFDVEIK